MLSRHSNTIVPVCSAFPQAKLHLNCSISTINISNDAKIRKDVLWQQQGLTKGKRAPSELMLRQSLKRLFPNEEIVFNGMKAINIKREGDAGALLEVDASIPRLKFHVEYQDPYHYTDSLFYTNRPLVDIQAVDAFKKKNITERGETLLQLPCWWDGTDESLVATIKSIRPDLLPHQSTSCQPVPETEPRDFIHHDSIPDVGPLMRPVFFTNSYYKQGSVWLGNEKLDGVRCCWNQKQQKLYSRYGNELRFTEEHKQHMPDAFLDGEAWFGRGQYNEATKLKNLRTATIAWPFFRISVFDLAGTGSTQIAYGERYKKLHSIIANEHPFLIIPSIIQIIREEHRLRFESLIANNGGEGMILTERNSFYEYGHTSKVLKVKPSLDKEALVVASDNGYLTLQLTDGTRFRTLIPDIQPPPRVQDVITFTYNRCVQGSTLPDKPQILRVRADMTWCEVVASANEGTPKLSLGSDFSTRWDRNLDDLKGYFIRFAQDNGFDPLIPDNWYTVQAKDILALLGAANMLRGFNHSVINALIAAFPDIGLEKQKFIKVPQGHWKNIQNVRKWFDDFATQKGFDPLVAQNWYTVTSAEVFNKKGGYSVISHFSCSVIDALVAAYPDIGINKSKFSKVPQGHWKNVRNVRKWFVSFATEKHFEPLVASNWTNIGVIKDIIPVKGGSQILAIYKSLANALAVAFPELNFSSRKRAAER